MNDEIKRFKHLLGAVLLLGAALAAPACRADDRHFGYSYESSVMPDGGKDLESFTTFRFGRDHFYSGLDQSLEFEVGLPGDVSTSLYLNYTQALEGDVDPVNTPQFNGIANEWRFKLADNVADPLGFGLLFEPEVKPDELELETKVIVDKRIRKLLWTLNLTAEPEYHLVDGTTGLSLIPSAGIGFSVSNSLFLGAEAQLWNFYENDQPGHPLVETASILSMGPVVAYTAENWCVSLTFLPQVRNLRGGGLDFTHTDTGSQRRQFRLDTSVHL